MADPQWWPQAPPDWDRVTLWQYTDKLRVPGINGPVDGDLFNGTLEELRKLGMPDTTDTTKIKEECDRIWHIAGLLDGISAHDTAQVLRDSVIVIKQVTGTP